jgi:DNA-binding transcriptional ArsR family regulator
MLARLDDAALEEVARYFAALAVPMRLKILDALRGGERNVGELTAVTGATQANVSKHLAMLAANGLVEKSPRGTNVFYRIADPRVYELCDLVCGQVGRRLNEQASWRSMLAPPAAPRRRSRGRVSRRA